MRPEKLRFFIAILIAGLIGYGIGLTKIAIDWRNFQPHLQVINNEPPPSVTQVDFSPFWAVMEKVENNYYDKKAIDPQKMLNGAIDGMIGTLDDPFTTYLPPVQNKSFQQFMAGQFEGIGAELGTKDKATIIIAPLDGSPAEKAGLQAGDIILKVNGESIATWSLPQTVNTIRGKKGTSVTLTMLHKASSTPVDVKITRNTITVKSLTTWTKKIKDIPAINTKSSLLAGSLNDKIAYIRLSQFGDNTNSEWTTIAIALSQQLKADKSIKGIVFDLRNNPGGYLQDAVYIASEFIKDGDVVLQEDKNGDRQSYPVSGKGMLTDVPVVVLLNKGSASASEIVAGALRDHKRALLVGETSFGKGTMQDPFDLGGGASVHVTVAKWLTPNGTWVNKKGLTPDISVALDPKDPARDTQLEAAIAQLIK